MRTFYWKFYALQLFFWNFWKINASFTTYTRKPEIQHVLPVVDRDVYNSKGWGLLVCSLKKPSKEHVRERNSLIGLLSISSYYLTVLKYKQLDACAKLQHMHPILYALVASSYMWKAVGISVIPLSILWRGCYKKNWTRKLEAEVGS